LPETVALDSLDVHVAAAFDTALGRLSAAGANITRAPLPVLKRVVEMQDKGGISSAESYAWHRELIARRREHYDPRVLMRIMRGAEQDAAFYISLIERRSAAIAAYNEATADFDAVIIDRKSVV